jgi:hypothetical protein
MGLLFGIVQSYSECPSECVRSLGSLSDTNPACIFLHASGVFLCSECRNASPGATADLVHLLHKAALILKGKVALSRGCGSHEKGRRGASVQPAQGPVRPFNGPSTAL